MENNNQQEQQNQDSKSVVNKTYCKVGDPTDGFIVVDLVFFRESGVETRYLKVDVAAPNEQGQVSKTSISISDKETFEVFKKFISGLDWNS